MDCVNSFQLEHDSLGDKEVNPLTADEFTPVSNRHHLLIFECQPGAFQLDAARPSIRTFIETWAQGAVHRKAAANTALHETFEFVWKRTSFPHESHYFVSFVFLVTS